MEFMARPNDNSSDYDSDDYLPLSQLQAAAKTVNDNFFSEIPPTPELAKKRTKRRRRTINYKDAEVTKSLPQLSTSKPSSSRSNSNLSSSKVQEPWECVVCYTDYVADRRACAPCGYWVHEDCVGLIAEDIEDFVCPDCVP